MRTSPASSHSRLSSLFQFSSWMKATQRRPLQPPSSTPSSAPTPSSSLPPALLVPHFWHWLLPTIAHLRTVSFQVPLPHLSALATLFFGPLLSLQPPCLRCANRTFSWAWRCVREGYESRVLRTVSWYTVLCERMWSRYAGGEGTRAPTQTTTSSYKLPWQLSCLRQTSDMNEKYATRREKGERRVRPSYSFSRTTDSAYTVHIHSYTLPTSYNIHNNNSITVYMYCRMYS